MNTVAVSAVAPRYAERGTLVASTVLGVHGGAFEPAVRAHAGRLHGCGTAGWEFVTAYPIHAALPPEVFPWRHRHERAGSGRPAPRPEPGGQSVPARRPATPLLRKGTQMTITSAIDTALDRTLLGYGNLGYLLRRHWWPPDPPADALAGRVAAVTGAKTGLGKATATGLAGLGATVHLLIRGRAEGETARSDILAAVPGARVVVDECDVSSFAAVRRYADAFTGPLHLLVHNAGVMPEQRTTSVDGHELAFATHVLGPHLLTGLLRPALSADPPARVIWVTSGGMYAQRLPIDDLEYERSSYRPAVGYARTKRMQAVLTTCWAEKMHGSGVVVHAVHPGWADTPGVQRWLPKFRALTRPLQRTPQQGADTFVWVAAADPPGRCTGQLWQDRAVRPYHYTSRTRESAADRSALWDACQRLTGLAG